MTCRELFVMEHPDQDLERAILETCPHDFGIRPVGGDLCLADGVFRVQDCRKCWEQEAELTGTDMGGGIRWDDAGNVIDWGIAGPPGEVGRTEAGE